MLVLSMNDGIDDPIGAPCNRNFDMYDGCSVGLYAASPIVDEGIT
jgi:hypothetical protein